MNPMMMGGMGGPLGGGAQGGQQMDPRMLQMLMQMQQQGAGGRQGGPLSMNQPDLQQPVSYAPPQTANLGLPSAGAPGGMGGPLQQGQMAPDMSGGGMQYGQMGHMKNPQMPGQQMGMPQQQTQNFGQFGAKNPVSEQGQKWMGKGGNMHNLGMSLLQSGLL